MGLTIQLLRFFAAYRRLEAQLREEAGHRIATDDKIRALAAQVASLEGKEVSAKNESIDTLKHFVDFIARNTSGRTVFGSVVEEVQIGQKPEPTYRAGVNMRTVVRQQTAEFHTEEAARLREFYSAQI